MLNQFSSNGSKFGHHPSSLQSYRWSTAHSVISTHISPEGNCNLSCAYCSAHKRVPSRIKLKVIEQYIYDLLQRGLRSVVITGGGEPLVYPQFNDLLEFLFTRGLEVGLITNGTLFNGKVSKELLKQCTWIRVSVNRVDPSKGYTWVPPEEVRKAVTFGLSMVFEPEVGNDGELLKFVVANREAVDAEYVRVVCDCLPRDQSFVDKWHAANNAVKEFGDKKTFFQGRYHQSPIGKCHLGHFRPYLSEVIHPLTQDAGVVFACDSIPLHNSQGYFNIKWVLCPPSHIIDYLEGDIKVDFHPGECNGCLFSVHNEMISDFLNDGKFPERKLIGHVNFV